jgi:pheromone shutdown protein TraB
MSQGTITLVPSVHFSPTHRRRVRETIREVRPDLVAVELDETRFERLRDRNRPSAAELARRLPPATAAAYNALRLLQRSVVRLYGLDPEKTDMETAIETADELEVEVALIDDPVSETMAALSARIGVETLPRLFSRMARLGPDEVFTGMRPPAVRFADIEDGDDVQPEIDRLRKLLPEVVEVIVDRRDRAMAERLDVLRKQGYDVVAVIGAGHHNGVVAALAELETREDGPRVDVPIRSAARGGTVIPIE